MIKKLVLICIWSVVSVFGFSVQNQQVFAEKVVTVAVLPFEVLAGEDLSFLGKGMARMICSRVGDTGLITVQCRPKTFKEYGVELDPSKTEMLLATPEFAGIDFIVRGTIVAAGPSLSTDVELIDLSKTRTIYTFHEAGPGQADVVRQADMISWRIKQFLLGEPVPQQSQQPALSLPPGGTGSGTAIFTPSSKPDYGKLVPGQEKPAIVDTMFSAGSSKSVTPVKKVTPWPVLRSRSFKEKLRGVSAGDVDGDGIPDLVLIDEHTLMIYGIMNGELVKKAKLKGKYYHTNVSVDAADINGNGKAEIFVSALGKSGELKSFILEWNGQTLDTVVRESELFYRVLTIHNKKQLFGQKGEYAGVFSGEVFPMEWEGTNYSRSDDPQVTGNANIYSIAIGDLFNKGTDQMIQLSRKGDLSISDPDGRDYWHSSSSFGSTPFFIESVSNASMSSSKRVYINARMDVRDLDGDKLYELILVDNHDLSKGLVKGYRKFTKGSIKSFAWNKANMALQWEGANVEGYIADWTLEDMDLDGTLELVYINGDVSGSLLGGKRSVVVVEKLYDKPE